MCRIDFTNTAAISGEHNVNAEQVEFVVVFERTETHRGAPTLNTFSMHMCVENLTNQNT